MATYALTFATRAAFDTSLASGDIYNLMQGVTSSKPSVAITATITESGETFACGTNVMVDIKSVGPGDYVMYDSTNNKFFGIASKWIDNNYPAQPTQHIMIFKAGVLPARYVVCGVCIKRYGNRVRLAGVSAQKLWAGGPWIVSALPQSIVTIKKSRTATTDINTVERISYVSQRIQEASYPSGNINYFPILRAEWDAALAAGQATVTGNGKTVTMADFDNLFDRYLAYHYAPLFPVTSGALAETNGRENTAKIVADFANNHDVPSSSSAYAAGYCYNYSVSAPGLGRGCWFLGVLIDLVDAAKMSYGLPTPFAWSNNMMWASSQYATLYGWRITNVGSTSYAEKTTANTLALPLADLILEN